MIRKILDLSTAHISKLTNEIISAKKPQYPVRIQPHEYGFILFLQPDHIYTAVEFFGVEELFEIIQYAQLKDCPFINLDCDAPPVDGLKTFEW